MKLFLNCLFGMGPMDVMMDADDGSGSGGGSGEGGQGGDEEKVEISKAELEELQKIKEANESTAKALEILKKEKSGLDKSITELQKSNRELKDKLLSDEERKTQEEEERLAEQKKKDAELAERERRLLRYDVITELEISKDDKEDVEKLLTGLDEDALKVQGEAIKAIVERAVKAKDDEWLQKMAQKIPGSSGASDGDKEKRFKELHEKDSLTGSERAEMNKLAEEIKAERAAKTEEGQE